MITQQEVHEDLARGEDRVREELSRRPPSTIDDTIAALRNWASFSDEAKKPAVVPPPASLPEERAVVPPPASLPIEPPPEVDQRGARRARRNEPCPCGSGKKYKKCCGSRG